MPVVDQDKFEEHVRKYVFAITDDALSALHRLRVRVCWAEKCKSLRAGSRLSLRVSTDFNQNCTALGGWMAEAIQVCFGSRLDPTHRGLALALKSSMGRWLRPCN